MNEITEKVAVIIPCYNYGEYIEETVNSVKGSTYNNLEIIVVDDGSTDQHTILTLNKLSQCKDITLIRQKNGGLSAARNSGILKTDAKYIVTLDADDLIHPSFIEKGVKVLEENSNVSFVYSLVQLFGLQDRVWETLSYDFHYLKFRNYIPATIILRREAWENVGGYDESMREGFEDWEFLLRLGGSGYYGWHINEILFFYRKHSGSMLEGAKKKNKHLRKVIINKHKEMYKYIVFQWIVFVLKELVRRFESHKTKRI